MLAPLLEDKIAKLTKLIEKEPTAGKYRIRSEFYLRKKDYRKALADAEKAIELGSDAWNYAWSYNSRGDVYFAMKNFGAALADYCKAIELYPDIVIKNTPDYFKPILNAKRDEANAAKRKTFVTVSEYKISADSYFRRNRYDLALADYSKAIELEPNDAFRFKERGDCYFAMKKYDAALADYCKAVELYPEMEFENHLDSFEPTLTQHRIIGYTKSRNYVKRGHLYFELGNYKKAIADYNKVIAKRYYIKDANLYFETAHAHYMLGHRLEAVRYFRKALNRYSESHINDTYVAEACFECGVACYELKRYKEAFDNFDRYIFFKPEDSEGYRMRAKCYRALHDESKAQADFARAGIRGRRLF